MKKSDKVAIVCCSNGLAPEEREKIEQLRQKLAGFGLCPVLSGHLYTGTGVLTAAGMPSGASIFSGTAMERAGSLMDFFRDKEIKAIFDVSGGDIANEILPFLDFGEIAASEAVFCGYSDLTTVMNAIYAKTGKASVWYQAKNLVGKEEVCQCAGFETAFLSEEKPEVVKGGLFDISHVFLQGSFMRGVVVGGNVRCLLKLAGTPYWPDMKDKILFMEARSGSPAQMVAYLNQLKQMGVFAQVKGILLGTFLQLEKEERLWQEKMVRQKNPKGKYLSMADLVRRYAGTEIPIAQTADVGHRSNSRALWIGREYSF